MMAYILNGTQIRAPHDFNEGNSTQMAQQRVLEGSIGRDYFGSNKRIWVLSYENCNVDDFGIIKALYESYLDTATTLSWEVTETNYTVSLTNVHVDLLDRNFGIRGSSYISNFNLVLTEA